MDIVIIPINYINTYKAPLNCKDPGSIPGFANSVNEWFNEGNPS